MNHKQVIALWLGLIGLAIASYFVLAPVIEHMLQPMLDFFPGMKHDRAVVYVSSIGHLLGWILAIVIVMISLGVAAAVALWTLAEICPPSRLRIQVTGALAAIAVILFIYFGFVGQASGLHVDLVEIVGQDTWPGIEYLEYDARRAAALGTATSFLIFFAMVGLIYRGPHPGIRT